MKDFKTEEIASFKATLKKLPSIRTEKVEWLRKDVEAGRYWRDTKVIVNAILSEARKFSPNLIYLEE